MQRVEPNKTVKRGERSIRTRVTDEQHLNTAPQRMRGVTHTMTGAKVDGTKRNPEDQTVPAFIGLQANLSQETQIK